MARPQRIKELFNLLFKLLYNNSNSIKLGHSSEYSTEWSYYSLIMDYFKSRRRLYRRRPKLSYVEEINPTIIKEITLEAHLFIIINKTMTLPNFLIEYK